MKIKRILLINIAIVMSLLGIKNVFAEATRPASFYVTSDGYAISTNDYLPGVAFYNGNNQVNVHEKTISGSDKHVFCTDLTKSSGTCTYNLSKELDAKYAYVINKSLNYSVKESYFTKAVAIWYLSTPDVPLFTNRLNLPAGTYEGTSYPKLNEIWQIIQEANNYTYPTPSISINNSASTLSLSGSYYVSSQIGITSTTELKDNTYTVSLTDAPSGTIITDVNGTTKTTFSKDDKFIVRVPESSITTDSTSFTVGATATAAVTKAYEYVPEASGYQPVAVVYPEYTPVSATATLNINVENIPDGSVQIKKTDMTTGEEIPGAYLIVKNATGEVVDKWYSGTEPHIISDLNPGTYTLTETLAPDGYVLNEETIEFTINSDGSATRVEMKNKPIIVTISKRHVTKIEELPGAYLVIKDENGEVAKDVKGNLLEWTSSEEPRSFHLKPGTYILSETIAPEGYELSEEEIKFVVDENGNVLIKNQTIEDNLIIFKNAPEAEQEPLGDILIIAAWIIGISAIAYTTYYYRNNIKEVLKNKK